MDKPITINCEGLSKKRIVELADDLCPLYRTVIIADNVGASWATLRVKQDIARSARKSARDTA